MKRHIAQDLWPKPVSQSDAFEANHLLVPFPDKAGRGRAIKSELNELF